MEPEKINKRFNNIKVVPGNGYSPHTGCVVFYAFDTKLNKDVTVKSSDGIKNNHMTIREEHIFLSQLNHSSVINILEYYQSNDIEYMIMEGTYLQGGRRERWRKLFNTFNEDMSIKFIESLIDVLFYLQENDVLHGDVECANMVYDDVTMLPVLIDFGRSSIREYSKQWLLDQLSLDKSTKQNAFFREITNTGGVYATEPPHFKFDVKPIIENILDEALGRLHRHG